MGALLRSDSEGKNEMKFLFLSLFFLTTHLSAQEQQKFSSAFVTFKDGDFTAKDKIEITDMPPTRSQDSIGLCYAFTAATLLDYAHCKKNKIDCKNPGNQNRVSTLDISRFTEVLPKGVEEDEEHYIGFNKIKEGGSPFNVLQRALLEMRSASTEECAPFSAAVNEKFDDRSLMQKQSWESLKTKFEDAKAAQAKNKNFCINCVVDDIQKSFTHLSNKQTIVKALGKTDYENFLYTLLVPAQCHRIKNSIVFEKLKTGYFPDKGKTATPAELTDQIKKQLLKKNPVILGGLCIVQEKDIDPKNCSDQHAVVISGMKKMCDANGVCHQAFKVNNSWGEGWQKQNDDGWVLADELLRRTNISEYVLNWIEPE